MFKKIVSFLTFLSFILSLPSPVLAISFNPNYIISDKDLTDPWSISLSSIQKFLENKGALGNYKIQDVDEVLKTAAQIIWRASITYKINPKFLIALLQKEQSLVEDPSPSPYQYDWATGYGVCDSCKTDDPKLQKYKGFANQVDRATKIFRYYFDHPEEFRHQEGKTYSIDGYKIIPANKATAYLYNYTPHYNGNLNFWKIWTRWFSKTYPDGTVLRAEGEHGVWLIQNNVKRPFVSKSAFFSRFSEKKILTISKSDLELYETGLPIKFANYSLLRSPGGTVFLLVDDTRRGIADREAFKIIGFNPEEIIDVEWNDLKNYKEGESLTVKSVYPMGALLQDKTTGGVYYIENGIKKPIWGKELLTLNFSKRKLTAISPQELIKYSTGDPVKLKDGELVKGKGGPAVFVISNGERKPLSSEEIFKSLGYKWENIIIVSDKVLNLHPIGSSLSLGAEETETALIK